MRKYPETACSLPVFKKDSTRYLITSASAVSNNLAAQDVRKYGVAAFIAVIHEGYVNIIPVYNPELKAKYVPCVLLGARPKSVTSVITQVKWGTLKGEKIFVMGSTLGLHVYDEEAKNCMYENSCCDSLDIVGHFVRGLAFINQDYLCVGNSSGVIYIFTIDAKAKELAVIERKTAHSKSITDLASSGNFLISADESGIMVIWQMINQKLQHVSTCSKYEFPCTSIAIWKDIIIAGYGSGHIRIFELTTGNLTTEVAAHARWISAIDVAPEKGYVLSVSEDSFAKVWQILTKDNTITHISSTCVTNSFLVGGKFLNNCGTSFCVSTFDSREVQCYNV